MTKASVIDRLADVGGIISRLMTTLTIDGEERPPIPENRNCPVPRSDWQQTVAELARVVTKINDVIKAVA